MTPYIDLERWLVVHVLILAIFGAIATYGLYREYDRMRNGTDDD